MIAMHLLLSSIMSEQNAAYAHDIVGTKICYEHVYILMFIFTRIKMKDGKNKSKDKYIYVGLHACCLT